MNWKPALGIAATAALALTGCSSYEDLREQARCSDDVVTGQENGKKILELAPDGIDDLKPRFHESDTEGYRASCTVGDGSGYEGLIVSFDAGFLNDSTAPSNASLRQLARPMPVDGRLTRVVSRVAGVGGVSGSGGATLRAPCALSRANTLPTDMRDGFMVARASAEQAPDADSQSQRQNVADLALSFLRHAVQRCDAPPNLPRSVRLLS